MAQLPALPQAHHGAVVADPDPVVLARRRLEDQAQALHVARQLAMVAEDDAAATMAGLLGDEVEESER